MKACAPCIDRCVCRVLRVKVCAQESDICFHSHLFLHQRCILCSSVSSMKHILCNKCYVPVGFYLPWQADIRYNRTIQG